MWDLHPSLNKSLLNKREDLLRSVQIPPVDIITQKIWAVVKTILCGNWQDELYVVEQDRPGQSGRSVCSLVGSRSDLSQSLLPGGHLHKQGMLVWVGTFQNMTNNHIIQVTSISCCYLKLASPRSLVSSLLLMHSMNGCQD